MSRFAEPQHADFRAMNDSLRFDWRLGPYDVAQSRAHAAMLADRRRVAGLYAEALADVEGVELPLPRGVDRDDTVRALAGHGVQSKPYLPAIHLMSFYRERFGHREGQFPVCEDVAARSIALPFFPAMTEGQVARVAEALHAVAEDRTAA